MSGRVPIAIIGALGRMGREIAAAVLEDSSCRLAGAMEQSNHPAIGKDYGDCLHTGPLGVELSSDYSHIARHKAVAIDFSTSDSTAALISGKHAPRGHVIGTTGLGEDIVKAVKTVAKKVPILYSPNMSLGVNLLFHLTEVVARKLAGEFDIEIVEAHHRHKRDAPSGTARRLGEIAASALDSSYDSVIKNGRCGIGGERPRKEIGMHAVRGGDIVGDHTVLFAGAGERVELRHVAHSRSTFARGAVTAAKWLYGRQAGLYTMRDVLGI